MLLQVQHLYDLSLLGFKWISDANDHELQRARSISPMLYTLREAGLLSKKQHLASMNDARLRIKFCNNLVICQETPGEERKDAVAREILDSPKHLALELAASQYKSSRVIDQHGYRFLLTDSGREYATGIQGPYQNIITRDVFIGSWQTMRERVARIMSVRNSRRTPAGEPDPDELGDQPAA